MSRFSVLAAVLLAVGGTAFAPVEADGQSVFRERRSQFSIPLNFISGTELEGQGGSLVDLSNDVGWGFGYGYHVNSRFMVGFDATWLSTSYEATIRVDDDNDMEDDGTSVIGGGLDAVSFQAVGQFNMLERSRFTPFVRGNLGITYADSNIPTGPPQGSCWWDPWWGYYCGTWQPTYDRTSFSFGGVAGGRADFESFFFELGVSGSWIAFENDTPFLPGVRLNVGLIF
ncbi:MAG: outer membrane beta-barrel protein [Gemmatimonadota bacterium]|nr:outer membrane beta-barrel protein [Gemmatimonadota bacterium]